MSIQILHEPIYTPSINRILKVVPLSGLITLGLLLCMYALIKNDYEYVEPPVETPRIVDFMMKPPPPIDIFESKPVRPVEPDEQPPMPQPEIEYSNPGPDIGPTTGRMKPPVVPNIPQNFGGDQLMALIKVQPNYPSTAASRGIEGFVEVVFDVTPIGTTENIRIAYAEPSSVFNKSVIQAIQRWKYKPKLVEGKAVKAFDVRERITFELDK